MVLSKHGEIVRSRHCIQVDTLDEQSRNVERSETCGETVTVVYHESAVQVDQGVIVGASVKEGGRYEIR